MYKAIFLPLFLIFLVACNQPPAKEQKSKASEQLHALFAEEWDFNLKQNPMMATAVGKREFNNQLPTVSEERQLQQADFWRGILKKLAEIDDSELSEEDQINYELFRFVLEDRIAGVEFERYLVPISADGGFHIGFVYMVDDMPFQNDEDYENYLQRLRGFKAYVDQHIVLMKKGLEKGRTLPKVVLNGYEQSIVSHIVDNPEDSHFYGPFKKFPESMSAGRKSELQGIAKRVITESIIPGYATFNTFMQEEYMPNAAEAIGISEQPNGKAFYEQRVRYFSTLPMTAEEIFQKGETEVARIKAEMMEVIEETSFEGSFADFIQFLRTDPQFYAKTPKELLKEAAYFAKKIDGKLPEYFNELPSLPYGVAPVPDAIAPKYTGGRYIGGGWENHRAGFYWVNTYKLNSRPLYVIPSLTLHEAVPGHHLQISLAQEMKNVPPFRKHTYLSSYGEGWALYTEWLGKEMGIYETPYQQFGRLTYEMWRACRLVVDVGIHAKGWSRQQAVDFLASNTALSIHEVNTEIDRYIGWPGQALSYKIGELKIRELRKRAEQQLGERFDLRKFHQLVLKNGAVPLYVLEKQIEEYITG